MLTTDLMARAAIEGANPVDAPLPECMMERAVKQQRLPTYSEIAGSLARYRGYGGQARFTYAKRYGYGIPCHEVVQEIARYSPLLELGAGNGFWTFWLRQYGCDAIATDIGEENLYTQNKWVDDVVQLDAAAAVKAFPGRNVVIVWPHFAANWTAEVIQHLKRPQTVCYVGEGPFGCCAPPSFFVELGRYGFEIVHLRPSPSWPRVTDFLAIYGRV